MAKSKSKTKHSQPAPMLFEVDAIPVYRNEIEKEKKVAEAVSIISNTSYGLTGDIAEFGNYIKNVRGNRL